MSNDKKDINRLKEEIASLKTELNKINDDKEEWFTKKEELKKEIADLISKVKTLRKVSIPGKDLENLKNERDNRNIKVKELIGKIQELKKEKSSILLKYNIEQDPEGIKRSIDKLDEKIETEALSISAEKKLMEKIKSLKKSYNELGDVKSISDKINDISKEINEVKGRANVAHETYKTALKKSRKGYKEFFSVSRQINVIKKQQERAFDMFISFKNKFADVSRQLKDKLFLAKTVDTNIKKVVKEDKKKKVDKYIEEKAEKAEEKLKKGKKLTNEDILAMQGKEENL